MYADVIYANEWKIENKEDLLEEVRLTGAKGAGITGGDPLVVVDRVCEYITFLKNKFGKEFHTHLYTPLQLVTKERLQKLANAGLDEIRFHPNIDDKTLWKRIFLARKYSWDIGIEIPCIPKKKKEILELIAFVKDKVKFINLNELEFSEPNEQLFDKQKLKVRNTLTYAIKGSSELAKEILNEANAKNLTIYFCTAKLKDGVQMKNRFLRRAKSIATKNDLITSEGTIIRNVIYLEELAPGMEYRKKLETADKISALNKLKSIRKNLSNQLHFIETDLLIDEVKLRFISEKKFIIKYSKELKRKHLIPAIVEEHPTREALEMDVTFL